MPNTRTRDELPIPNPPPFVGEISRDMQDIHNSIFYAAFSTTRMPMLFTDPTKPDNPIVLVNPAFLHMTGYDEEEVLGNNCRFLQGPETNRETVAQIRQAVKDKKGIAVDILNYRKNKSTFWNGLFISPVFDKNGDLIHFFASQLDVTRRLDAEEALRQSQKMEAVGQLTSGVAHDFNNLLTVIQGFGELLQSNVNSESFNIERAKRSISAILQATEKGSKLTSQLLAFSRKQKLEGRVINIKDLITQLLPLIYKSLGEGIRVDVEHIGTLCNTRLDTVQAEMAIMNIAVNARDAMSGNGVLTITTKPCDIQSNDTMFGNIEPGSYIQLSISDNGCGMDPDTLAKITEPFFTTKGEGKGTGLGMSMVDGFIRQSEGAISVDSKIGKGTNVHMLFKCVQEDIEIEIPKAQKQIFGSSRLQETILVVEDKADVGEFAEAVLTDFGYRVLRANNADEALKELDHHQSIQLLFSDIVMPGSMDGVQLAREVLKRRPEIKVLLTTGYTDVSVDITDVEGNRFDVVHKPYKLTELTNHVRAAIDGPDGIS